MWCHSLYSFMWVLIIKIWNRYPPFSGKTDEKIMEKVNKGTYSFDSEEWEGISKDAKELIKKMLTYDPCKRYFINNLAKRYTAYQCLNDPWIRKYTNNLEVES